MKASMDSLRRKISGNVESLRSIIQAVVDEDNYDPKELRDAMNQVIIDINTLNCVFAADNPTFTYMGDIEIEYIKRPDGTHT